MVCLKCCYSAPPRHILVILAGMGVTLGFAMRQVLPILIQEMTIPLQGKGPRIKYDFGPKHQWSATGQALILMGFYIGYSLSYCFAGAIVNKFGARTPIITGMTISAAMTGLIPLVSDFHWTGVFGLRILTGIGQSVIIPGVSSLLNFWIPLECRPMIAALIYTGVPMGNFMGIYLSAIVAVHWESWHWAFYMWSGFTACWLLFFVMYIYSYPKTHPRIATQGSSYQNPNFIQDEEMNITEKITYCCQTLATFGHTYILFTLDTYLPKFLNEILDYELEDYSIYAATPFALMYLCGILSRIWFTSLVNKRNISVDFLRVIYCSLSNVLCGLILVMAFWYAYQASTTIALIHAASFLGGFFYGGLNMLDMSIRETSKAISIVIGLATTSGVISITVITLIVKNNTIEEWRIISYIIFGVEVVLWIFDGMFTMTKFCLMPRDPDKNWYHHIPKTEHKEKMAASQAIKEELKAKQRGDPVGETSQLSRPNVVDAIQNPGV